MTSKPKKKRFRNANACYFMTLQQIADLEGLSVMQIRSIINNALKKIRKKNYIKIKKLINNGGLYTII